jgi:hypothetical protein
MQADMEDDGGYIKLRSVDSSSVPKSVQIGALNNPPADEVFHDHTGSVLEFKINGFCANLDTRGYRGYKSKNPSASDMVKLTDYFNYGSGYLSIRYFLQASDKTYYDKVVKESGKVVTLINEDDANKFDLAKNAEYKYLTENVGNPGDENYRVNQLGDDLAYWTAYGAYKCFDENFYMGYKTKVIFTIPSEAIHRDAESGKVYISYVLATCRISDKSLSDASEYSSDTLPIYFKEPMRYENSKTSLKYD